MKKIADAGLVIAFLNTKDLHHAWAVAVFNRETPPFYIAEPVITEIAAVTDRLDAVLNMVEAGDLVIDFALETEVSPLRTLIHKYRDQGMDLGDACCVRMAELLPGSSVYTVDRRDFSVYRKNNRQPIPCVFPDQP